MFISTLEKKKEIASQKTYLFISKLIVVTNMKSKELYNNQKNIAIEIERFEKYSASIRKMYSELDKNINSFNGEIKNLGDVENWLETIKTSIEDIDSFEFKKKTLQLNQIKCKANKLKEHLLHLQEDILIKKKNQENSFLVQKSIEIRNNEFKKNEELMAIDYEKSCNMLSQHEENYSKFKNMLQENDNQYNLSVEQQNHTCKKNELIQTNFDLEFKIKLGQDIQKEVTNLNNELKTIQDVTKNNQQKLEYYKKIEHDLNFQIYNITENNDKIKTEKDNKITLLETEFIENENSLKEKKVNIEEIIKKMSLIENGILEIKKNINNTEEEKKNIENEMMLLDESKNLMVTKEMYQKTVDEFDQKILDLEDGLII
ncbi:hypothetical protein A3Q56_02656 [Intoshia linei]|uniref:Uncharacterized protein n=1 Tax=Intoshia linei TaxID=1819745 RepID=A0A177B7J5_9BILA|nr:hypothetical protein A3Q56_02656 [Intoshia linei]